MFQATQPCTGPRFSDRGSLGHAAEVSLGSPGKNYPSSLRPDIFSTASAESRTIVAGFQSGPPNLPVRVLSLNYFKSSCRRFVVIVFFLFVCFEPSNYDLSHTKFVCCRFGFFFLNKVCSSGCGTVNQTENLFDRWSCSVWARSCEMSSNRSPFFSCFCTKEKQKSLWMLQIKNENIRHVEYLSAIFVTRFSHKGGWNKAFHIHLCWISFELRIILIGSVI